MCVRFLSINFERNQYVFRNLRLHKQLICEYAGSLIKRVWYPYVSVHYLAIMTIGFIMSEVHFLFRRKAARQGRPCTSRRERTHPSGWAAASVIDAREIVSIAPWNEVTMRVVICMSRAAVLCCWNEELWRGVDKTSTQAGQSDDYDRIESEMYQSSSRIRIFFVNVYACDINSYCISIARAWNTDWVNTEKRWNIVLSLL